MVTADALAKTAYIDESMRVTYGLYVLAAVIVADHHADHHRAALRAHLYRGQLRVHWRDESNRRRTELITAVSALAHTGAIVVATGTQPRRQERARRKCIERLPTELASRGISTAIFERRHPDLDARDRTMIASLRRQQALPAAFQASWQQATAEPLLWGSVNLTVCAVRRCHFRVEVRDLRRRLVAAGRCS